MNREVWNRNALRLVFLLLLAAYSVARPANAAEGAAKSPWKVDAPIVTYWAGPAMTDAVAQQMAEGGWNLVWCGEKEGLPPGGGKLVRVAALENQAVDRSQAVRDVSSQLAPLLTQHKLPGMAAAVLRGERVIALGAAGVRRLGSPEKIMIQDKFHIGSCTKAMTATLCAMLVEEGKLSWQTTLEQAFPDLAKSMDPVCRSVTLEQLLTNRGGMPENLDQDGLWQKLREYLGTPTGARQLLLEGVVAKAPVSKPGTKFLYSNAGFAIAGHMAEKIAAKSWEDLMRERLFRPLGMASAGFGAPGRKEVVDEPRGHTPAGKPVEPGPHGDNPAAIGPARTVHCSIQDWAKFVALHLRGEQGDARLLKAATFKKLHTPAVEEANGYAMGWGVTQRDWGDGTVLSHSGSNTMWFVVTWIAPKRDFAVLVACNQGGDTAAKACDEACAMLIKEFLEKDKQPH